MRKGTAYVLDAIWTASLLLGPVAIAHAAVRIASDAAAACVAAESTGACGSGSGSGGDEHTILNPDTSTAASAAGVGTCLMSSAAAAALWPLVWAAAGASSAAGAARCLGLAGVLASERLFWRASPPARAAMAVMAAEGLRGAALWPPGALSEMLGKTRVDALASLSSDAAAGPGPPGGGGSDDNSERKETATTSGGGPTYPILLPHMLRVAGDGPCWRGAAWAKLVVALGMQIMRERANPQAPVAEPGAQRPTARRVQSGARPHTPAEALAASLAAFDGRELPGGAVLLCQEAPLQVCMLNRRVLSPGPYIILPKWC